MTTRAPFLPAFANAVATWFPELQGRCIAVSEADVFDKSNLPTLPIAMVSLIRNTYDGSSKTNMRGDVNSTFVMQMYFKKNRYRLGDGSAKNAESPFYAYFDYERIEDILGYHCKRWKSPRGGRVHMKSMDQESDEFAYTLSFQFEHEHRYFEPDDIEGVTQEQPVPFNLSGWFARPNVPFPCVCVPVQTNCTTCKPATKLP